MSYRPGATPTPRCARPSIVGSRSAAPSHVIREVADRIGGRKTFKRLLIQEGFADLAGRSKSTATRLLQIVERLPDVTKWHADLTPHQQIDWASPSAVFKHCPVFAKPKVAGAGRRTVAHDAAGLRKQLQQTGARETELAEENAALGARVVELVEIIEQLWERMDAHEGVNRELEWSEAKPYKEELIEWSAMASDYDDRRYEMLQIAPKSEHYEVLFFAGDDDHITLAEKVSADDGKAIAERHHDEWLTSRYEPEQQY